MDTRDRTPTFEERIAGPLTARDIEVFQINVGYRCNLECAHCHIGAGPLRSEMMSEEVMEMCLRVIEASAIPTIDITGGTPEMHPEWPWFLERCAALRRRLLVRTNGVILLEEAYAPCIEAYARCRAEVVVSLPHMDPRATDRQRGEGVFASLIAALRKLNGRGYGQSGSGLVLNLVHNPSGAYLPGAQASLEDHYRRTLGERYGIVFNHLFCLTNMPIGRYLSYLKRSDNYVDYMAALSGAFNAAALENVMCRTTL
jgi:radical SAM/Cys-rich protein